MGTRGPITYQYEGNLLVDSATWMDVDAASRSSCSRTPCAGYETGGAIERGFRWLGLGLGGHSLQGLGGRGGGVAGGDVFFPDCGGYRAYSFVRTHPTVQVRDLTTWKLFLNKVDYKNSLVFKFYFSNPVENNI